MTLIGARVLEPPTVLYTDMVLTDNLQNLNGLEAASGNLGADAYPGIPQISLIGPGVLNWLSFYVADATTRTITVKIEIDSTETIEDSLAGINTQYDGGILVGIGHISGFTGSGPGGLDQIPFDSTCKVYLKSSVAEEDKTTLTYIARKT